MKKHIFLFISLAFLASSCAKYLPIVRDMPVYPYGSHGVIKTTGNKNINGELLAVAGDTLYVMSKEGFGKLYKLHKDSIKNIKLELAINSNNPKMFQMGPKLTSVASTVHGYYEIYTLPFNLILSIVLHPNKVVTQVGWQDLRNYCRFPQGIPEGVNLNSLAPPPLDFRAKNFVGEAPLNKSVATGSVDSSSNQSVIKVYHPNISLCIYEVGASDDDVVSVQFAGETIFGNGPLTKRPLCFDLTLASGVLQHFSIKTIDGGQNPNDLVKVEVKDGERNLTFYLTTEEGQTAGVFLSNK